MKQTIEKIQGFLKRHEQALLPVFLLFGFAVDSVTLRRVDLLPETILIYGYLALSGIAILLLHLIEEGKWKGSIAEKAAPLLPLILTYAFGSLFSAFVVFYTKSASITDSWPFIAVLLLVVVGLEVFKKYKHRLVLNLTVFFLGIFSVSVFAVPLWVGSIGPFEFFLSCAFAVVIFCVFCMALFSFGRKRVVENLKPLSFAIVGTLAVMIFSYSTNILPPIPLVLKDIGVYHSVERIDGEYILTEESYSIFDRLFGTTVRIAPGNSVYVFSSVFTPVVIKTDIVHRWEYWNAGENKWIDTSRISFPAVGGRDRGYRGFSLVENIRAGLWRVSVETPDGLKIGRVEFTVAPVSETPTLVTLIR